LNRFRWLSALSLVAIVTTAALAAQHAPKVKPPDVKQAFENGRVELTFTGKEEGKMLDLKITNVTSEKLIVMINEGTTIFNFPNQKISLYCEINQTITLNPEKSTTVKLKQNGGSRITGGSMTVRMNAQ
jgi:hypothetical protein